MNPLLSFKRNDIKNPVRENRGNSSTTDFSDNRKQSLVNQKLTDMKANSKKGLQLMQFSKLIFESEKSFKKITSHPNTFWY